MADGMDPPLPLRFKIKKTPSQGCRSSEKRTGVKRGHITLNLALGKAIMLRMKPTLDVDRPGA